MLDMTYPVSVELPDAVAIMEIRTVETSLFGSALDAILVHRIDHFMRGHTPDTDGDLPPWHNVKIAVDYLAMAKDFVHAPPERRDYPRAQRKLAQVAALCMAAHDRLAAEIERETFNGPDDIEDEFNRDPDRDATLDDGDAGPYLFDDGDLAGGGR